MRFNCAHTFIIEADDLTDFDAKIKRYRKLVDRASRKLDIGYEASWICGQPSDPIPVRETAHDDDDQPVERLFD